MTDVLWLALRLIVAAVLVVSAVGKLRDLAGLAESIGRYRLLPSRMVVPVAWTLTAAELITTGFLLAGLAAGFWLSSGLFLLFGGAVGSALARRLAIPCGCFGGDDMISPIALVRVGLLFVASVVGLILGFSQPARLVGGWDLPMAVTIAIGGMVLGRLVLLIPDVRTALGVGPAATTAVASPRDIA